MSVNQKILLYVVGGLFLAFAPIWYFSSKERAAQNVGAIATVIEAEVQQTGTGDDTIVELTYDLSGTPATGWIRLDDDHTKEFPAGKTVQICYNPADPKSVRLADGPCSN